MNLTGRPLPLWLPVLIPLVVALLGYYLPRRWFRVLGLVTQSVQVSVATTLFVLVRTSGPRRAVVSGWPGGVGIALSLDRVAVILVMLTAWFFFLMLVYSLRKRYSNRLFQFLYLILQSLLVALFLSGDLFNVYVLLELSTLVVAILIMWKRDRQTIYDGVIYLMLNLASMTFMLLGVGMVYRVLGTLDIELMAERVLLASEPRALILPYSLVATAVGVKAALVLVFSWLPRAHGAASAPSIVSAILSGVQVKAGVYLLIRLMQVFGPALPLEPLYLVIGFLTAISGFVLAIAQTDIKLILAYHTVSQVGLIVIGLASGTDASWWGGVYHIVNHAFFKALLFLTAGAITHSWGTRNVYEINGVFRRMPVIAVAALAGVLGITGAPYFNGSVSKYLIQGAWSGDPIEAAIYLVNLGTAISFVKFSRVFFGRSEATDEDAPSPPRRDHFVAAVSIVMGAVCLAGGVFAAPIIQVLFGVDLSVAGAYYLEKALTYAATIVAAFLIYRYVIQRFHPLDWIRDRQLHFNDLVTGMLVFFGATAGYLAVLT